MFVTVVFLLQIAYVYGMLLEKEGIRLKKKTLIALLLVLTVFLSGFSVNYDDDQVRTHVVGAIDALIAEDFMALRAHINEQVPGDTLNAFFAELSSGLSGVDSYDLEAVNKKIGIQNGQDYVAVRYVMTTDDMVLEVDAAILKDQYGLASLHLNQIEEQPEPELAPKGILHWGFTGIGILSVIFTVWMVVDCIRRRMKRKWLWLPLILLGVLILTLTVKDGSVNFRFHVGLFLAMTGLETYITGGFGARICVPLAAIVYFFKRKDLTEKPEIEGLPEEPIQSEGEEG